MNVLISTIGSRGEVQPVLALALALRSAGHDATVVVPPDFKPWVESFRVTCIGIGPEVKKFAAGAAVGKRPKPDMEKRRQLAAYTVHEQFRVLAAAARGHDVIVGAGSLQMAARSVAEALGVRYVFASFCPATLPSRSHPPTKVSNRMPRWLPGVVNSFLWKRDEASWNSLFGSAVNEERAKLDLPPLASVQPYVFTDRPLLAADPVLAPMPGTRELNVVQSGAWLLSDPTPLPDALERFLADGEPPIYFGFGSMRAASEVDRMRMLVDAARAVGRRAIVARGWSDLSAFDHGPDCLVIGDVNHGLLFPRVAVVVHHGGAGTTTAAALGGRPQVVVPHMYDQFYWAGRVAQLGVGVRCRGGKRLSHRGMVAALRRCLSADVTVRATALARRIDADGARRTAERLAIGLQPSMA